MLATPQNQTRRTIIVYIGWLIDSPIGTFFVCLGFTLGMIYHYVIPLDAVLYTQGDYTNDCWQVLWNLWIVAESLVRGQDPFTTSRIFYPTGARLAHHTLTSGFFPITFLARLLSGGDPMYPVYAYRLSIWLSFTLLLYCSYLLLRELRLSRWAAATAAVAYGFCNFYLIHAQHLNLIAGFFLPLVALGLVRWYHRPTMRSALLAAVAAAYSIYCTEFALFIYISAVLALLLLMLVPAARHQLAANLRQAGATQLLLALAIFLGIAALFLGHFLSYQVTLPPYEQISGWSANLAGFFIPDPGATPLYGLLFAGLNAQISVGYGGAEVFLGFPPMIFAAVALARVRRPLVRGAAGLALIFFVFSLGPTLKVFGVDTQIPLPYMLLMHMPPFAESRTPARLVVFVLFFLMLMAAFGMAWAQYGWAIRWGRCRSTLAVALIWLWTVAEVFAWIPRQAPFAPPHELAQVVPGPVLNLPPYSFDGYAAMLQVFHQQPIGSGYLARTTAADNARFIDWHTWYKAGGQQFCERAARMGFRNLIISPDEHVLPYRWGYYQPGDISALDFSSCSLHVIDLR